MAQSLGATKTAAASLKGASAQCSPRAERSCVWLFFLAGVATLIPWNVALGLANFFAKHFDKTAKSYAFLQFIGLLGLILVGGSLKSIRLARISTIIFPTVLLGYFGISLACYFADKRVGGVNPLSDGMLGSTFIIVLQVGFSLLLAIGQSMANCGFFGLFPLLQGCGSFIEWFCFGQSISGVIAGIFSYGFHVCFLVPNATAPINELQLSTLLFYCVVFGSMVLVPLVACICFLTIFPKSKTWRLYLETTEGKGSSNQSSPGEAREKRSFSKVSQVLVSGLPYEISIFLIFACTLAVIGKSFGQPYEGKITGNLTTGQAFYLDPAGNKLTILLVFQIFIFQVADAIGRFLGTLSFLQFNNPIAFLLISVLRWAAYVLLLQRSEKIGNSTIQQSGFWNFVAKTGFVVGCHAFNGLTNGYFSLLIMIGAGSKFSSSSAKELVGKIMPLFLLFGILVGLFL